MTIPNEIDISQISEGDRGRTEYNRIEELSQSIHDNGLIQPIVLVPLPFEPASTVNNLQMTFGLDAGGRRFRACKLLGYTKFYHAATSTPGKPGFVLKGEDQATPLKRLMTEIAENLDREDMPWRDEMSLLTKAWRLAKHNADSEGQKILMRDYGAALGVGYQNLQAAVMVHDDVIANPERYKDCTGYRQAYSILLKYNAEQLTKLKAIQSIKIEPLTATEVRVTEPTTVSAQPEPALITTIPLTSSFHNVNALEWMNKQPNESFDHIITDPDYGVAVERLEANMTQAAEGVHQKSVKESLGDFEALIVQSFDLIKPQGFLVFWYDMDHHEKLQNMATAVGYAVQRWPLIWHKTDYRSNAAPQFNFTKNIEYAMVCRKPNAVLAKAQNSSIYSCATGNITKELGHPFAKPYEIWHWIYNAVALKGQTVYDPFVGRGSSVIAAIKWGLRPIGNETNPDHYYGLLHNLQNFYKKELGSNVQFT